ncbi:MAG: hypothetical protein NXI31_20440 [bacterium]|nr:hypothetical protein [bacterium]
MTDRDLDIPISPDDTLLQHALRMNLADDCPDFVARTANANVFERKAAATRALRAATAVRPLGPRLAMAAVVLLGLGVTTYLAADDTPAPHEQVRPGFQPSPLDLEPRDYLEFSTWQELVDRLEDVSACEFRTRPCYRDLASSSHAFRTSSQVLAEATLDQATLEELVQSLRTARPIDAGFQSSEVTELRTFELQFQDGRWSRLTAWPAKKRGNLLLATQGQSAEMTIADRVANVSSDMTAQLERDWVHVLSLADLVNAEPSTPAVLTEFLSADLLGQVLAHFPRLERLEFRDVAMTTDLTTAIAARGRLRNLSLGVTAPNPARVVLQPLARLRALETLTVDGGIVDTSELARLSQLRDLTLENCELTGPGLELIAALPLTRLALRRVHVGHSDEMAALHGAVQLARLEISVRTQDQLDALPDLAGSMPRLRHLRVMHSVRLAPEVVVEDLRQRADLRVDVTELRNW